jgi:hypothetical protein
VLLTVAVLLGGGLTILRDAGAASVLPVRNVPTSIDRTGHSDVTAAIVAFINNVPDGSTIVFPAQSRYRIEGIVLVSDRHNLVIDGSGSTFFATTDGSGVAPTGPNAVRQHWPRHRDQWLIVGGSNITVRNVVIRGVNTLGGAASDAALGAHEGQAGFEFFDTTNSVLQNCSIMYTYGDLVYIGNGAVGATVRDCHLGVSGRQGVTVSYASKVLICHNNIEQVGRSAIDLEPETHTWSVHDVWIVNNTFKWIRSNTIAASGTGDVSSIVVANNHLTSESLQIYNKPSTPVLPRRHDWTVVGNVSDQSFGSPHAPLWITDVTNVSISGNFQPLQKGRGQIAVDTSGSTNVQISGNSFPQI